VGLVFFAFNGWELVASTTEEYRNPRRDLPIVMASSFVVIVVLYVGVALAVQMSVGLSDPLLRKAPIVAVLQQVLGPAAGSAASLLGILIILATLTGGTWATSRIAFATARERLLPAALVRVDDRSGAPVPAVVVSVAMFAVVLLAHAAGLLSLATVFELAAVNFVLGYASSVLAFAVLFRRPWHRVMAVVAAVPVLVVLAGFGWNLLCPLALVLAGAVAHRVTRHAVAGGRAAS
jgi:amino acid efflux transporter